MSRFDEVVVGGGIAGLTTALLLARRGRSVALVEAREIGAGASGRAGAATVLQGDRLGEVRRRNTLATTVAYAESQTAALDWLRSFVDGREDVPHREADAVAFSVGARGARRLADELVLARGLGLPVRPATETGLPWRTSAALVAPDQLGVDAPALLAALAAELRAAGGEVLEHRRVIGIRASSPVLVTTDAGELQATRVVLATGTPILDRGLYFAKTAARTSVLVESRMPEGASASEGALPLATGVDAPLRTVRSVGDVLVTGGRDRATGRIPSLAAEAARIADETARWWPGSHPLGSFSAEDWETPHRVPFVGWLPRGRGRIFIATGLGAWGLTNGVAAALTLEADLLGGATEWQRAMHRRMTLPPVMLDGLGEDLVGAGSYLAGWGGVLGRALTAMPAEGAGETGMLGAVPAAISTVDGQTRALCAICPHLGGIVRWNDLEQSWDCPAHGSRFAADGSVLDGPSRAGLAPL